MPLYPAIDNVITNLGSDLSGAIETLPRYFLNNTQTLTSNKAQFLYLTAPVTMAVNNITLMTGNTIPATPTHAQVGLYTVGANGQDLTLVANSTDSTTVLNTASTAFTIPLTTGAPYTVIRGVRYAIGVIVAFTTPPNLAAFSVPQTLAATSPRIVAAYTNGTPTVLPSSVTVASGFLLTASIYFYASLQP